MTTPPSADDRSRWAEPMTQEEIDALEGVYWYDNGYAAAEDVQRLITTLDASRAAPEVERLQQAIVRFVRLHDEGKAANPMHTWCDGQCEPLKALRAALGDPR